MDGRVDGSTDGWMDGWMEQIQAKLGQDHFLRIVR